MDLGIDMIVLGEITMRQLLYAGAAVAGAILCLRLFRMMFPKKVVALQHTVYYVCENCNWEGHVSKFGNQCPKCGSSMK